MLQMSIGTRQRRTQTGEIFREYNQQDVVISQMRRQKKQDEPRFGAWETRNVSQLAMEAGNPRGGTGPRGKNMISNFRCAEFEVPTGLSISRNFPLVDQLFLVLSVILIEMLNIYRLFPHQFARDKGPCHLLLFAPHRSSQSSTAHSSTTQCCLEFPTHSPLVTPVI